MIGVLLINLGTPDAPTTPAVRKYLRQFLSDPYVIDIPWIARQLLLNLIILPFRSPKSAKAYEKIWTETGSPLLLHSQKLAEEVQKKCGNDFCVELGMRYGQPSIASALKKLVEKNVSEIRILPLFPQYATSSTETALVETKKAFAELKKNIPLIIKPFPSFYSHPGFIQSFVENGKTLLSSMNPDHILFSFHGLPERHIKKLDKKNHCLASTNCCDNPPEETLKSCYRAQCFVTAKGIAQELKLLEDQYTICFQSRLGRTPWIKPYTDLVLPELIQKGKKRFLVFCPAFVADCLETLEEIQIRLRESALSLGAQELALVPSLNATFTWVDTVVKMTS